AKGKTEKRAPPPPAARGPRKSRRAEGGALRPPAANRLTPARDTPESGPAAQFQALQPDGEGGGERPGLTAALAAPLAEPPFEGLEVGAAGQRLLPVRDQPGVRRPRPAPPPGVAEHADVQVVRPAGHLVADLAQGLGLRRRGTRDVQEQELGPQGL